MNSRPAPGYAELACATNFSFLRGASPADQLVLTSLLLGHCGLGIADRNTVAGVVRAWAALRELREGGALPPLKLRDGSGPGEVRFEAQGLPPAPVSLAEADDTALQALVQARAQAFRLVTGARLAFADGTPDIIAYPENRAGWGRLCRLLTLGNRRTRKGACELGLVDLLADSRDLLLIAMPGRDRRGLPALLHGLGEAAPGALWLGASMPRRGDDRRKLAELAGIAEALAMRRPDQALATLRHGHQDLVRARDADHALSLLAPELLAAVHAATGDREPRPATSGDHPHHGPAVAALLRARVLCALRSGPTGTDADTPPGSRLKV